MSGSGALYGTLVGSSISTGTSGNNVKIHIDTSSGIGSGGGTASVQLVQ